MWTWFYESSALLDLPVAALIVFAVTFALVVARVVSRRPERAALDHTLAHLPLLDDEDTIPSGGNHG